MRYFVTAALGSGSRVPLAPARREVGRALSLEFIV